MVHGQEQTYRSAPFSEKCYWKVIQAFSFVEGIRVAMSRCYSFPPPGYEKKSRTDGGDLLKKEKDRERKHKKEKKDRQKGEGKGKKDKDRSDGKSRDKKDRKEKRRDKKDRDKDKDRTRTSASDEKKLNLQFEHNNGNKITVEKKRLGIPEGGTGETFTQKGKENDIIAKGITVEKKLPVQISGHNGEKITRNNHLSVLPKDAKVIQELGQKVKDDDRGARNHLDGKFSGDFKRDEGVFKLVPKASAAETEENIMRDDGRKLGRQRIGGETRVAGNVMAYSLSAFDSKRGEGMIRVVNKATTLGENKETNMKVGNRRLSDQGSGDEMRFTGNVISESLSGTSQTKIGLPKLPEEVSKKSIEGKERTKQKESDHKHNDRDNEKKSKRKDKDRDRKKEEKLKEKNELKKAETDKLNKSIKNDLTATSNVKPSPILNAAVAAEGDPRTWKDSEQNGVLNANEPVPNKLPGPPSQPVTENGRILKASQASIFLPPGLRGAVNNVTVGNKERKINGLIEAHALSSPATRSFSISPSKPLLTPSQVDQRVEGSRKPPHPDTKCLHEILTVPKMEEWSNFDDQEWLFQESQRQSKRSKVCSYAVDGTPQVWSETLRIDSADVYALPYVVPY